MKIVALVALFSLVADGNFSNNLQDSAMATRATLEAVKTNASTMSRTTTKPLNDCPDDWVYGGVLGCFYFNTDAKKVFIDHYFLKSF